MRVVLAWVWLAGCDRPAQPILSGLAPAPAGPAQGPTAAAPYQTPEGVLVDVAWLAGRPWDEARDVVAAQLGAIQAVDTSAGPAQARYTLERGRVELDEGRIVLIHVDLPRPTRRAAALQAVNLPITVDSWFVLSGEFRLRWEAGFERVRLGREPGDPERVLWVEVRRWDPRGGDPG